MTNIEEIISGLHRAAQTLRLEGKLGETAACLNAIHFLEKMEISLRANEDTP
jgi:hypothetical protein